MKASHIFQGCFQVCGVACVLVCVSFVSEPAVCALTCVKSDCVCDQLFHQLLFTVTRLDFSLFCPQGIKTSPGDRTLLHVLLYKCWPYTSSLTRQAFFLSFVIRAHLLSAKLGFLLQTMCLFLKRSFHTDVLYLKPALETDEST